MCTIEGGYCDPTVDIPLLRYLVKGILKVQGAKPPNRQPISYYIMLRWLFYSQYLAFTLIWYAGMMMETGTFSVLVDVTTMEKMVRGFQVI